MIQIILEYNTIAEVTCVWAALKLVLELSGLFVCLGEEGLLRISVSRGQKKLLGCGLLGGISAQADTLLQGHIILCP